MKDDVLRGTKLLYGGSPEWLTQKALLCNVKCRRLVQTGIRVPVHSLVIRAWQGWTQSGVARSCVGSGDSV
jgi:hypothetical protein